MGVGKQAYMEAFDDMILWSVYRILFSQLYSLAHLTQRKHKVLECMLTVCVTGV